VAFLPLFYVKVRQLSAGEMSVLMSLARTLGAFFSFVVRALRPSRPAPVVAGCSLLGLLCRSRRSTGTARCTCSGADVHRLGGERWLPLFMGTIPSETIPARYVATSMGLT